jgi:hypothetical protein
VEDYLQLYNVRALHSQHHLRAFAARLHLTCISLSLAVQEKHRGESLVAQHAKTAKEQQAAKVLMRTVDRCLLVVSCSCSRLLHIPVRRRLSCACVQDKAKEDEEWKPWDRDEMGSRHLPKHARESVMRKAKDFHSRFSAQSGSRFL